MSHIPGLTSLLVADNVTVLQTAPSWRCTNETEYLPSPVAWSSIPDVIDARAPAQGWTAPSYDDSAWGVAAPVDGSTWGDLFPRAMPLATETALPLSDLTLMPAGTPLASALPLTLGAGQSAVIDLGSMAMVYADLELWAPAAGAVLNLDYALRFVGGNPRETYGAGSTLTTRAGAQRLFGGGTWGGFAQLLSRRSVPRSPFLVYRSMVQSLHDYQRAGALSGRAGPPCLRHNTPCPRAHECRPATSRLRTCRWSRGATPSRASARLRPATRSSRPSGSAPSTLSQS